MFLGRQIFRADERLHDLLLTKLINGERAAMFAPEFRGECGR
jgi:hypothetical protein